MAPALYVTYSGLLGGAERLLLDLASATDGPVVVACPDGELAAAARDGGLGVLTLPARPLELRGGVNVRVSAVAALAAHAREVARLVETLRPGIVVAWGMRSVLGCALLRRRGRPPVLAHLDDLPPPGPVGAMVRAAASRADRVVAVSLAVAAALDPKGRLNDRLVVIAPGVDLDRFAPVPAPEGALNVLAMGAIVGHKRLDVALEAVARAAPALAELTLTVAGAPLGDAGAAQERALRERAGAADLAGRVTFTGPLADPREALARASCLLHCGEREAFGLAAVEALASARPVVAADAGGLREIVDESCGRRFAPGDPAGGAAALVEVLADPAVTAGLGTAARERAERLFDAREGRARYIAEVAALRMDSVREAARTQAGEDLALVTVTHDSARDLGRLLASVKRHLPAARVIVVDSGSADASAATARRLMPAAEVIEMGANVGFGRASNAGVRAADRSVCVLVNPDVELLDDSLSALAAELRPTAGPDRLLAPLVLNPDGTRQDTVHPAPASVADLTVAVLPPALLPRRLRARPQPWRAHAPRRVGWAVGCCVVARTETLRRLGPFDERIFLYGEDLDLALRAADAGVETWFCPAVRVVHRGGHAAQAAFGGVPLDLLVSRRLAVVRHRRGARRAALDGAGQAVLFSGRFAAKTLLRRDAGRERRQLRALLASARRGPRGSSQ